MQEIQDKIQGEINSHKEVDQRNNDSSLDESFARLEERITNEIKEFMSRNEPERSGSSKQVKEDKLDTNSESANNISKEGVGEKGGSKLGFPTAEIVGHSKSEKVGHVNRAPEQNQQTSGKSDKEHNYNEQHVVRQEKIRTAFSNAGNDKYTDEPDRSVQGSKSSANRTSTRRYHDHKGLVITTDEPLTAEKPATVKDKQQLFHHKEEQMMIKDKQNPETTHTVGFNRPALVGKIRAQRLKEEIHDIHGNSESPTTTGFRRNQPMYGPSPGIFSLADALKMQNIVSYLRGTTTHTSPPTASPSFGPNRFSLKSLYYYPMHPTPQGEPEDDSATKSKLSQI